MSVPLLTIVAPAFRCAIHHVLIPGDPLRTRQTTRCGMTAAGWNTLDPQTLEQFMASAYSCSRCRKALTK